MSELQRDLTRISHNTKIVATLGRAAICGVGRHDPCRRS